MHMKTKKDDKDNESRYSISSLSASRHSDALSTRVTLSPHTLEIAHQLGSMPISTIADQTNYLLKTPSFTNSIFADAALATIGAGSAIHRLDDIGKYSIGPEYSGAAVHFKTQMGIIPLYTEADPTVPKFKDIGTSAISLSSARDISNIMITGLAVEAVSGMVSSRIGTQFQPLSLTGFETPAAVSSTKKDSIFATSAFQQSFQALRTDFVIDHKNALEKRVVLAMESMVFEKKRENDLKERELNAKENEDKEQNSNLSLLVTELREIMARAFPSQQLLSPQETSSARFRFDSKAGVLTNSSGKSTQKISGQALVFLECLLRHKKQHYICPKDELMKVMRNKQSVFDGSKKQLTTLLGGVGKIISKKEGANQKDVTSYQLVEK